MGTIAGITLINEPKPKRARIDNTDIATIGELVKVIEMQLKLDNAKHVAETS